MNSSAPLNHKVGTLAEGGECSDECMDDPTGLLSAHNMPCAGLVATYGCDSLMTDVNPMADKVMPHGTTVNDACPETCGVCVSCASFETEIADSTTEPPVEEQLDKVMVTLFFYRETLESFAHLRHIEAAAPVNIKRIKQRIDHLRRRRHPHRKHVLAKLSRSAGTIMSKNRERARVKQQKVIRYHDKMVGSWVGASHSYLLLVDLAVA